MMLRNIVLASFTIVPATQAQQIQYTLQGQVMDVVVDQGGYFSALQESDPVSVVVVVDSGVSGVLSAPQQVTYSGAIVSVSLQSGFLLLSEPTSGDLIIRDDQVLTLGQPICRDQVFIGATTSPSEGFFQLEFSAFEDVLTDCPNLLTSTAIPNAFDSTLIDFQSGQLVDQMTGSLLYLQFSSVTADMTPNAAFLGSCFGDGGVTPACTPCPCGNDAPSGTGGGCINSNAESARLVGFGEPAVAADTLRFELLNGSANSFAGLLSGDAVAPTNPLGTCFGLNSGLVTPVMDGLRCVVQAQQRHGVRSMDSNGDIGLTNAGWGAPDGPTGGLLAQGGFSAGQTRHFQVIYRDDPASVCETGLNSSQALSVTFTLAAR